MELRVATWNVNGLRSFVVDDLPSAKFRTKTEIQPDSNLGELISKFNPDIICFQETRCDAATMDRFQIPGYHNYHSSSQGEGGRAGNRYSGVAVWSRLPAVQVWQDLPTLPEPRSAADREGRFLSLDLGPQWGVLINTYQPNAGTNFGYRVNRWDPALREYLAKLTAQGRPIIWCGDLNVARTPVDLHLGTLPPATVTRLATQAQRQGWSPDTQQQRHQEAEQRHWTSLEQPGTDNDSWQPGFTLEERLNFELTLETGLVDAWRHLHPDSCYTGYTWWNQRIPAYRKQDRGWRIDYCVLDAAHLERLVSCETWPQIGCRTRSRPSVGKFGSDHGVVAVTLRIPE